MGRLLSVVIPAYNEEKMIEKAYDTIDGILSENNIEHNFVFVDDGSKDNTWCNIEAVAGKNDNVLGVHFSRNFGKDAAIMAGLEKSNGDCVVVLDCDLQHPPVKIVEMYNKWLEGYEIVEAVKHSRGRESVFHSLFAKLFYSLISKATKLDMMHASDFKLLDRKAVLVLLNMKESNAFFRALSSWIGFKTVQVEFDVQERTEGQSKWSLWSLIKYAITNISSFSTAPMQIVTILGAIMFIISLSLSVEAFVNWLNGTALEGFTTVIILQSFSSSIIMLSLGIIGFYISRIYEEIKGRPRYIISCTTEKKN